MEKDLEKQLVAIRNVEKNAYDAGYEVGFKEGIEKANKELKDVYNKERADEQKVEELRQEEKIQSPKDY